MQTGAASVRFGVAVELWIAPAHMYRRPVLRVAALRPRARAFRVLQVRVSKLNYVCNDEINDTEY